MSKKNVMVPTWSVIQIATFSSLPKLALISA